MSSARIAIGVISDTHGLLRPEAIDVLQGSNYIVHAGDIGDPEIPTQLEEIAPVTAIRGNVDRDTWVRRIPETDVLEIGGISIYVLHNLAALDLKPEAAGFSAVVYGHTHVPKQEVKNKVLYFNPGAAGPRRFKLPISVGKLIVENGGIHAEIINLNVAAQ
ncbi:MAG TPA: metallophosphoesterase family protein [Terriglobales bacterium]|nr:metallophosphoesterase family protein [Terriglobales bacterium]